MLNTGFASFIRIGFLEAWLASEFTGKETTARECGREKMPDREAKTFLENNQNRPE